MKKLRTLCGAVVLALTLVVPASAGVMSTGITSPPPDSPDITNGATGTPAPTTDGNMSTDVAGQSGSRSSKASASVTVAGLALDLLQSVLSLA